MNLWPTYKKKRIYLDHAASTPVLPVALTAYGIGADLFGNPSSPHEEGRRAKEYLEQARTRIARLAEVKSDAVICTSGATEANALGIRGHIKALVESGRPGASLHVLYLSMAHSSLTTAVEELSKDGVECEALALQDGELDMAAIATQIRKETVLIALELVSGETGAIYPVRALRRTLDGAGHKDIRIFVDASQAPRVSPYALTHLAADMITLDAQKVGGVRSTGVLIAPRNVPLAPLTTGGSQERGLRAGTENPASLAAFAVALEDAHRGRAAFLAQAQGQRERLLEVLVKNIPSMVVHEHTLQAPHILSFSLPGRDTDYLVALLSEAGFSVSTKSACESNETGSRVILLRTQNRELAASTLRISWAPTTSTSDLDRFSKALIHAVSFIDTGIA